ncbi:MAG: sigma-70 family RNA polymerase sigma factor [Acidimicrobiia bacterium]|nr:sigma-70 family RNA polymerase sigma factor [Acidimicrobiia bacterium]
MPSARSRSSRAEKFGDALVRRAVDGDEHAIAHVWEHWNPRLLRFFRSRQVAAPDDLAAVVWVEIARKLPGFTGDAAAFRRWLFTTAYRRMIDAARRDRRRPRTVALEEVPVDRTRDESPEELDWALSLLRQLPQDQATAVALRILAEMDVVDVAAAMGKSATHVRVLTHRGLKHLAGLVEDPRNPSRSVTQTDTAALTPIK